MSSRGRRQHLPVHGGHPILPICLELWKPKCLIKFSYQKLQTHRLRDCRHCNREQRLEHLLEHRYNLLGQRYQNFQSCECRILALWRCYKHPIVSWEIFNNWNVGGCCLPSRTLLLLFIVIFPFRRMLNISLTFVPILQHNILRWC